MEKRKTSYSSSFNFISTFLNLWLLGGLYLDGWAHEHIKEINTFFTPWHGLYYLGFFLVSTNILLFFSLRYLKNRKLSSLYHPQYWPALLGVIVFSISGFGDIVWHEFYGFETSIEALVSPTHLGLYLGMFLIFVCPFYSLISQHPQPKSLKYSSSLVLSIAIVFSYMTFLTQYANPLISPFAFNTHQTGYRFYHESIGLVSLFLHTIFLLAPVLIALVSKKLPFGSLTVIVILNGVGMTIIHDHYDFLPGILLAGIVSDIMLYKLKPSFQTPIKLQLFSFFIPFIYSSFYFLAGFFSRGIWWIPQVWIGAIFMAGFFGWLISVLMLFPIQPKISKGN